MVVHIDVSVYVNDDERTEGTAVLICSCLSIFILWINSCATVTSHACLTVDACDWFWEVVEPRY